MDTFGSEAVDFSFDESMNGKFKKYDDFFAYLNKMQVERPNDQHILIIDEAQKLYKNCDDFLAKFKKHCPKNLMVLCFAGYGVNVQNLDISTPIFFVGNKSVRSLKLQPDEYDVLIGSYNASSFGKAVPIRQNLSIFIKNLTDSHVGLVKYTLFLIWHRFSSFTMPYPYDDIAFYLLSKPFLNDIGGTRCLNKHALGNLNEKQRHVVTETRMKGFFVHDENYAKETSFLVLSGLLFTCKGLRYRFASPLITKAYMDVFMRKCLYPFNFEKKTLFDFVLAFLEKIPGEFLKKAQQFKKKGRIYEKMWKDEIYSAITRILPEDISLNVEAPPYECEDFPIHQSDNMNEIIEEEENAFDIDEDNEENRGDNGDEEMAELQKSEPDYSGFLDFYINNTIQWGIEAMRDGTPFTIKKHLERFVRPHGKYSRYRLKDHFVIDFTHPKDLSDYLKHPDYMAVVFDIYFESFDVYHQDRKITVPLAN